MAEERAEIKTEDAKIYVDYDQNGDCPILTIQIVEGRIGQNSVIVLVGDELEQFKNVMRRVLC